MLVLAFNVLALDLKYKVTWCIMTLKIWCNGSKMYLLAYLSSPVLSDTFKITRFKKNTTTTTTTTTTEK